MPNTTCRRHPSVLRGELCDIDLVTVLELIERASSTGRLLLTRGYTTLNLDWIRGRIIADGAIRTFAIVAGWQDGRFELLPVAFDGRQTTYSVTELRLEAAYRADQKALCELARTARP